MVYVQLGLPQFDAVADFGNFLKAHTPPQLTSSLPQPVAVQTPATHAAVSPHVLPQSPQFVRLDDVGRILRDCKIVEEHLCALLRNRLADVDAVLGLTDDGLAVLEAEGIPTAELVARNTQRYIDMTAALGISNDGFIRTVSEMSPVRVSCYPNAGMPR